MRGLWFYGVIFLVSIGLAGLLLKEGFSNSGLVNLREYGGWPSVFLTKPYVVQVESDPHSIPTATYVPTSQPCAYPPCPALDIYQTSYFL
jgi:hypothetical protein